MRIHFIALGGSIMHSLALALKDLGHTVTGSDDEIYEPSRSRLAQAGLLPPEYGWFPERITSDLDLVVLGMHARPDNPEMARAVALGVPVKSFPEVVYMLSAEKTRVMVAGSHGKTSTTGMIAHVLAGLGIPADRMIGAAIGDLKPVQLSDAPVIILEGDEYLTSPVDPRPKFLHYHPQITVLTGIAWDHMNVFPTYADYIRPFGDLLTSLGSGDTLIYCADDPEVVRMLEEVKPQAQCLPYSTHPYRLDNGQVLLETNWGQVPVRIFGRHNLQNLSGALEAVAALGVSRHDFYQAVGSFSGAMNRLEPLYTDDRVMAYKDFAHAPSKVKATVSAVRERHPGSRLIAILELHTFSSLNPDFLPQYRDSLADADEAIVFYSPHTLAMKKLPELSAAQLQQYFGLASLFVVTDAGELEATVRQTYRSDPSVLLWMSSGRFDGLNIRDVSATYPAG